MPPIVVKFPNKENSFIRFPEGTPDEDIRMFLGTQRPDDFPLIGEEVQTQLSERAEFQSQIKTLSKSPFDPQSIFFKTFDTAAGILRGTAASLLDPEGASEGIEQGTSRFLRGGLIATLGGPTIDELVSKGAAKGQVGVQKVVGNPVIPFTKTRVFPSPAPPLFDLETGELDNNQTFRPVNFRRAVRQGLRNSVLGQVGQEGVERALPSDEFGFEFDEFEPDGLLERTSLTMSEIVARFPEFRIGGGVGVASARNIGGRRGFDFAKQQFADKLGGVVGAFTFSNFIDQITRDQIEFGRPADLADAIDRVTDAVLEGGKGAITGVALVGGQGAGSAIFGRAFGVPASALPGSSMRAMIIDAGGKFVGGTAAFGTVPPLLEGELPSVEGYLDAAALLAAFGIGEAVLARQIAAKPNLSLNDHVRAILVESTELLLPPPPKAPLRTPVGPRTIYIEGNRERGMLEPARQLPAPDPATIAEGPGFVRQVPGQGQIAPVAAPIKRPGVPRAFEEQVQGPNEAALQRLEAQRGQELDAIEGELRKLEGPDPARALPAPDVNFTRPGVDDIQPVAAPVQRPGFIDQPAPRGRNDAAIKRVADQEAQMRRGITEGLESIARVADRVRPFREFQEQNDLARKRGVEEEVLETQEVDAPRVAQAQTEFDIEGVRRDATTDAKALSDLVAALRDIEGAKATDPKSARDKTASATSRASELSGEAVGLRRAEARNIARQVVEADLVAAGESITDVLAVNEARNTVRVRVRSNEAVEHTQDIALDEVGIAGVDKFIEADRRARAAIDTATAGREAEMTQTGMMGRVRSRLFTELERLRDEEVGAGLNPFGRKPKKQKAHDEYIPPDFEQVPRHSLFTRLTQINQQMDLLRTALNNPELSAKDRARVERRLAIKRQEQIVYSSAANVAPFTVLDAREELEDVKFNDLRAVAKKMHIPVGKNPKKKDVIDKIISRQQEVKGQIRSQDDHVTLARQAISEFNAERSASVGRFTNGFERAFDALNRQISATSTILRDLRGLKAEHPELGDIFDAAIREAELIRGGGPAGAAVAHNVTKEVFGGLSKPEKDMLDKVARFRADIALNEMDPLIKGTIDSVKAKEALKNFQEQNSETYHKISKRVDKLRDLFQDALDIAEKEGLVKPLDAIRMRSLREFLPTRYAELTDPEAMGLGQSRVPKSSPLRRRDQGFEVGEIPDLETASLQELRDTARKVKIRGNIKRLSRKKLVERIEDEVLKRGARILDTQFVTNEYFTNLFGTLFSNRAAQAINQILEEIPNNGIVRPAKTFRDSNGRLQFREPEATEELIQFRRAGENEAFVVDKQFADAFNLRTQRVAMEQILPVIGIVSGARITKLFATGAGAPAFAAVALPRDFFHMRISTDILGHKTYKSWIPGVAETVIARDLAGALPDVIMRGKDTQQYLENGGAMDFLAQASLFQKGERVTDSLRAGIVNMQMAETNSMLLRGLQNISFTGNKGAKFFYDALQYTNMTAELVSRVAEMNRRKKQIAKEKGITVDELSDSDIRTAVLSARSRIDFNDGGSYLRAAEEILPYTRASVLALRGPGRTVREAGAAARRITTGERAEGDIATLGDIGALGATLLTVPMMLYAINRHTSEQGLKDLPSWAKGDIILLLPEELGQFEDEQGNTRQAYLRLPVDQSLYLFNVLSTNMAAMAFGDEFDAEAMEAAASKILTLPDTANLPLNLQIIVEQFTNRSTSFAGKTLYQGPELGIRGAEIEAENTSPALIRLGQIFPNISPERMQESLSSNVPNSYGAKGIAAIANKISGIEDVRTKDRKLFLQRIPGADRILKDFEIGRSAVAAGYEDVDKPMNASTNLLKGTLGRNLLSSRKRNDGKLVLDDQLKSELASISNEEQANILKGIVEREIDFEVVNAASKFPRVWRSILFAENPRRAALKYYGSLIEMTPETRDQMKSEFAGIARSRVRSKKWWRDFIKETRRFAPEWKATEEAGDLHNFTERALSELQEQGLMGPVP